MELKLIKEAVALMMIGGLVAFSSCSSNQKADERVYLTGQAAKYVKVVGVQSRKNKSGFMEVQANLESDSTYLRKFRYKIQWKAADGFPIKSHQTRWVNFSVLEGAPHSIKFIAPNKTAEDFQILIEKQY